MGVLPEAIEEILNAALVCEFSVVNARGAPVTHPMIPLYDGEKIFMTSSILFSKKLGHVRENPRAAISISDANAVHGEPLRGRVTIQGDVTLEETDPHTDWEKLLPLWTAKEPIVSVFYAKRVALPLFWERVIIELRPRKALYWEGGRTDVPPKVFEAARVA